METTSQFLSRTKEFLEGKAYPWWRDIICKWEEQAKTNAASLLLGGILLKLSELTETMGQGGLYWRITPFTSVGGQQAIKVIDIEVQGRMRDCSIWVDANIGGPMPTIRLSTGGSGGGGGVSIVPGGPNELGKVPANTKLFISSDVTVNGYIIERA
jgi:hypothetical protein